MMTNRNSKDKLIVALDVESTRQALDLISVLRERVGMFKVGLQLFTSAGPGFVREIIASGARVFLDLKFHDIPNTVAAAAVEATRLGVVMFNVHAAGGSEMMRRTVAASAEAAEREGLPRPAIIAVTVLTSIDSANLAEVGIGPALEDQVANQARLAADCGLDGVVASPREIRLIRAAVERPGYLVVTPGIRPLGAVAQDQKRIMGPSDAIREGASYLVVGRPIIAASDPARAAEDLVVEMDAALT